MLIEYKYKDTLYKYKRHPTNKVLTLLHACIEFLEFLFFNNHSKIIT